MLSTLVNLFLGTTLATPINTFWTHVYPEISHGFFVVYGHVLISIQCYQTTVTTETKRQSRWLHYSYCSHWLPLKVVVVTTSSEASENKVVDVTAFPFRRPHWSAAGSSGEGLIPADFLVITVTP